MANVQRTVQVPDLRENLRSSSVRVVAKEAFHALSSPIRIT